MSSSADPRAGLFSADLNARPILSRLRSFGLAARIAVVALLFGAEYLPFSNIPYRQVEPVAAHALVIAAALFLALGYVNARSTFHQISREVAGASIAWHWLAGHIAALLPFFALALLPPGSKPAEIYFWALVWYLCGLLALVCAGFALVPPKLAWRTVRSLGSPPIYALTAGLPIAWWWAARQASFASVWMPAVDLTFTLVKALLHLVLADVVANRATMTIGSHKFAVTILPACSGWEGTVLMLVFSVAWLSLLRREYLFPRALILIPAAVVLVWIANALRITALVLIGVAGAPRVAVGGFHSQAGWIGFTCVALGFALTTRKVAWFSKQALPQPARDTSAAYSIAAYLAPLMAIQIASMISHAASSGFEVLYPLRLIAAAAALWIFRAKYGKMNWKFGWSSVVAGGVVFAMWLAMNPAGAESPIPPVLAQWPSTAQNVWIALRAAAAVLTVPVAEELAFRGFLMRRLITGNFESLDPRYFTWFSVLISAFVFGLLHGNRWLAGAVAGLVYSSVYLRRGRIGDAVAAHGTTNALLAGWVLWSGNWSLW